MPKEFALVEFNDPCDESQILIEVIPSKWLFDNNTKCKYPPKKDKIKTTRLVMSRMSPGQDWDFYNLRLHHFYNTYNTALKAAKGILEGEVARTDADTDYDQPRKRKRNKKYVSSSEDEEVEIAASHVPHSTSSEIPAPDCLLQNKLKTFFRNNSVKTFTEYSTQKDTIAAKSFSCNESSVKPLSPLQLTHHNVILEKNPKKQQVLLNEEPPQLKKIKPATKLHNIIQHLDKENCLHSCNNDTYNKQTENFTNTISSKTQHDENENDVLEKEKTVISVDNKNNHACPNSLSFQGLSNADRDLLTTTLNYLKKLHGPVVSNLDRDLLRDVSSKLDILLMNQRRILNNMFPDEAIVERPENCPPLPLRDEKSFEEFNEFLKSKIAYSQFVSYLHAHLLDDSDQWSATTCLMSIILHNDLARLISWKGTRGVKISFFGTRIKEALFCAIMSRFPNQSLKTAEDSMKRWLNTSGQRK